MRALSPHRYRRRREPGAATTGAAWVAEETGFMLVAAILMLLVLTVLVGAVAAATVSLSNNSNHVSARARALAAADAGLQAALFRLNMTGGSTGATGSLGNGATYTYSISSLTSSSPCAGLWVQSSGQAVQQSCITSSGTVNGSSVRVQERVVGYTPASSIFPVNGIFAVTGFSAGQNFSDTQGDIRSNGQISFGSGASVTGNLEYLSGYAPTGITCSGSCTPVLEPSPLPIPTSAATTDTAYANAQASNNDSAVASAWNSSNFTYTSTTQQVTGGSGSASPIIFPSGTYYYCDVSAPNTNGVEFDASATATTSNPVVFYIDSPSRPGSTCAAGTGNFTGGKNTLTINNLSNVAGAFQIYVYGTPGCTTACPAVLSKNSGAYTGVQIYAPYSQMTAMNNVSLTGDFVIGSMSVVNNATMQYQGSGLSGGSGSNLANYYPSAHQICLPSTTTGGTTGAC